MPSGQIIKRHQDQLTQRNVPAIEETLVDSPTEESILQPNSDLRDNRVSPSKNVEVEVQAPTIGSPLRRSARIRKPVLKLDL